MKSVFLALVILLSFTTGYTQSHPPAQATHTSKAKISFDKPTFNFGTIPQNVPASHTYYFTNTGTEPLVITSATPSCGCTTPDWTKQPVAPGKKGFIKATYNAAAIGTFNKTITVASNANNSGQSVLTIKGEVKLARANAQKPASQPTVSAKKNE